MKKSARSKRCSSRRKRETCRSRKNCKWNSNRSPRCQLRKSKQSKKSSKKKSRGCKGKSKVKVNGKGSAMSDLELSKILKKPFRCENTSCGSFLDMPICIGGTKVEPIPVSKHVLPNSGQFTYAEESKFFHLDMEHGEVLLFLSPGLVKQANKHFLKLLTTESMLKTLKEQVKEVNKDTKKNDNVKIPSIPRALMISKKKLTMEELYRITTNHNTQQEFEYPDADDAMVEALIDSLDNYIPTEQSSSKKRALKTLKKLLCYYRKIMQESKANVVAQDYADCNKVTKKLNKQYGDDTDSSSDDSDSSDSD